MTIAIVTLIMTLTQVVAIGTLPDLATSSTPLASAAAALLGAGGAALMTFGATLSASGNNMGQALSGPRTCMRWPSRAICPRSSRACTPATARRSTAVIVTAGVSLLLALVRPFRGAGRGERHQPADRLRLHVRGHDPAALAAVRRGAVSAVFVPFGAGDSRRSPSSSRWRFWRAPRRSSSIGIDRAGGRRRAVRDCAVVPIGTPHSRGIGDLRWFSDV